MNVLVHKLNALAIMPKYSHKGDSCADVCSTKYITIKPGERALVPTGLILELPRGYECQVRARSGLAIKYGISVLNGVGTVDNGYRGELKVILFNSGTEPFKINVGERIAQIAIVPVSQATFVNIEYVKDTDRGAKGFGSTGV